MSKSNLDFLFKFKIPAYRQETACITKQSAYDEMQKDEHRHKSEVKPVQIRHVQSVKQIVDQRVAVMVGGRK